MAILNGCESIYGPNGPLPKVDLEIEYRNAALKQYYGYYLNGRGDVYQYNRNATPWEFQDSSAWSRETLDAKFAPIKNLLQTRPKSEVDQVETAIGSIAAQYSPPKSQCRDAGLLTYYAYVYNTDSARYTQRILLLQEGDVAQQNTSVAAQQLIAYIRSLNLIAELNGCGP